MVPRVPAVSLFLCFAAGGCGSGAPRADQNKMGPSEARSPASPVADTGLDTGPQAATISAEITPTEPRSGQALECTIALPPGADPATVVVSWTLDGVDWPGAPLTTVYAGDTIGAGITHFDERWECTVEAIVDGALTTGSSGARTVEPHGGNVLVARATLHAPHANTTINTFACSSHSWPMYQHTCI